jgi:hypothetical protein
MKQRAQQDKIMLQFMDGIAPTANDYMRNAHRKCVIETGLNGSHPVQYLVKTLSGFKVPADLISETGTAPESLRRMSLVLQDNRLLTSATGAKCACDWLGVV